MTTPEARRARENAARFDALLSAAVDGIIVIDKAGLIQVFNPACERLFGYAPEDVVGHNVKMLMPEPYQSEHDGYLDHYHDTGEKRIIGIGRDVLGRRKDGSTFPMYLSVGEGVVDGQSIFVGIIHDETAQQSAERRLRDIQAELLHVSRLSAMGQMAAMLAHEINQPLTAIANYLNACQRLLGREDGASKDRLREALLRGSEQAVRAGQIIQRMRGFVSRGENEQNPEDLKPILRDAIALAVPEGRAIRVDVRFEPQLPLALVDKVQIQQVMLNLLRNAAQAVEGRPRTELKVEARVASQMIQVSVTDSGPGLATEVKSQLFQPFVSTKRDGMGMGLSVCRSIVEAHGGQLWTEDNPGGGAVFAFTVPQALADEEMTDE